MKKLTFLYLVCLSVMGFSQNLPFPQHYTYTAASIKPTNYTQSQLDSITKNFYDKWKAKYFRNSCNASQYFVWFGDEDSTINCVSEGQGYGMMIAAYMAGYDPDAKTIYDGLYNYYKAHLDSISFELMAWEQNTACIDTANADNATDGDMDIAYSLLLANKQWGSTGTINYLQEANKLIDSIMVFDINKHSHYTELGDWADTNKYPTDSTFDPAYYYATRPSDFMPDHFRAFQTATGDNRWANVINECYNIIDTIQTKNSPSTGLIPDFVVNLNNALKPASANFLEGPYDGEYNYNSCRVPWRLTTDYLVAGETRAKTSVDKINTWLKSSTSNTPSNINSGFYLNGSNLPGNNYSDPSFIAPFTVGAMTNSANQTWLNGVYDFLLTQSFDSNTYFPNTLTMLDLIVISGNYWPPYTISSGIQTSLCNDNSFNLYPNPAKNYITIESPQEEIGSGSRQEVVVSIEIYNLLGEKIYTSPITDNRSAITINISDIPSGVNVVEVKTEKGVEVKRFIKE
jgi:endo-1,4-beta-D-glucanase Y